MVSLVELFFGNFYPRNFVKHILSVIDKLMDTSDVSFSDVVQIYHKLETVRSTTKSEFLIFRHVQPPSTGVRGTKSLKMCSTLTSLDPVTSTACEYTKDKKRHQCLWVSKVFDKLTRK